MITCEVGTIRAGEDTECGKPAIGLIRPTEWELEEFGPDLSPYPCCVYHARKDRMVPLDEITGLAAGTAVVEVELEEGALSTTVVYGTFTQAQAVELAAKIGSESGLVRNTWGWWSGSTEGERFAFVRIRPLVGYSWASAVHDIKQHLNRKEGTE